MSELQPGGMISTNSGIQAEQRSLHIALELGNLSDFVSHLKECVAKFQERLQPLCLPAHPEPTGETKEESGNRSEVAGRIAVEAAQIAAVCNQIKRIMDRLDI